MKSDWRPSFILAFVIFTAVVTSLHADGIVDGGGATFTISLAVMAAVMVGIHLATNRSGGE